ncbi:MAG TPA: sulfatase-like hydrolase/transferase, partial [Clostridia bacterium]|nr:sulfatase-like hydrolase/transferase [Clostridia bacterium]
SRPNVLVFMTDHQRGDTVPPFSLCKTPHLDAFSREAISFTRVSCPAPHCCPSRATFFSALYPSQHGVWNNVDVGNTLSRGLSAGVRLFSEDMREQGYSLYFSGKWHVSAEEGPQHRGFDLVHHPHAYTGIQRADETRRPNTREWSTYRRLPLCDGQAPRAEGEILRKGYPRFKLYGDNERPFGDADAVEASVEHIRTVLPEVKTPWFFYVGTLGPHDPYMVPKRFLDMYDIGDIKLPSNYRDNLLDKPALYQKTQAFFSQLSDDEHREALRHYLAFCSYEDDLFGQLLHALKEKGLYDNTLIVYTSDHGDYAGAHGLWAKGLPCFQEAYHVPLLIRMPGGATTGQVGDRAFLADFAPTILELTHTQTSSKFAGQSLAPYLTGGTPPCPRPYSFTQSNGNELYGIQRSIAGDKWKYVYNGFDYDELYDLENDPGELCNLARDPRYKPIIEQMAGELWRFIRETDDTCVNAYIMTAHMPFGPGIVLEDLHLDE